MALAAGGKSGFGCTESGRRQWIADGLALIGGSLFTLSLSPFDLWPFAGLSVGLLFWSLLQGSTARSVARFYLYSLGLYGAGVSWIFVSVHEYGGASTALAGLIVTLLVFSWSLTCLPLAWVFARHYRANSYTVVLGFSVAWFFLEVFRGWFLTGFPWLFLGYGVMGTPLEHFAPVGGVSLVSLLAALGVSATVMALCQRQWWWLTPMPVIVLTGVLMSQLTFTEAGDKLSVSLVQGNVDQHAKWHPENRLPIYQRYVEATEDEWGRDLIVWPEAALTIFREQADSYLQNLDRRARNAGSTLLLGLPDRNADGGFQNTVLALGEGQGHYVKRRLVPFGEYVPLEKYLRGLIEVLDLPMSRNQPGPDVQAPLMAGPYRLSTSICYEIIFPVLVSNAVAAPDLLLTVSNDTWFGASIGPWQHLQMARMRALEQGRYLIRGTNNGVTAIIDHQGRLTSKLPQFETAILRGDVEVRTGLTPYHQWGNLPAVVLALLMLALAGYRRHQ